MSAQQRALTYWSAPKSEKSDEEEDEEEEEEEEEEEDDGPKSDAKDAKNAEGTEEEQATSLTDEKHNKRKFSSESGSASRSDSASSETAAAAPAGPKRRRLDPPYAFAPQTRIADGDADLFVSTLLVAPSLIKESGKRLRELGKNKNNFSYLLLRHFNLMTPEILYAFLFHSGYFEEDGIDAPFEPGFSALHLALSGPVSNHTCDYLRYFLEKGADPFVTDRFGARLIDGIATNYRYEQERLSLARVIADHFPLKRSEIFLLFRKPELDARKMFQWVFDLDQDFSGLVDEDLVRLGKELNESCDLNWVRFFIQCGAMLEPKHTELVEHASLDSAYALICHARRKTLFDTLDEVKNFPLVLMSLVHDYLGPVVATRTGKQLSSPGSVSLYTFAIPNKPESYVSPLSEMQVRAETVRLS